MESKTDLDWLPLTAVSAVIGEQIERRGPRRSFVPMRARVTEGSELARASCVYSGARLVEG